MMSNGDGARLPRSGSSYLVATGGWKPSELEGFWTRDLLVDPAASATTMLMKIDPGAFASRHSHEELEQIYVLEGSFYDEERVLHAGDYCCRAAGAPHTAGSKDGAVVLLVYSKPPA
jgi:quercetin dioxygenase-like cupin family protein